MTTRLEKPVRRELELRIGTLDRWMTSRFLVIEMTVNGLSFRSKGRRHKLELTWREAFQCAERRAGELAHQEKLRKAAMARHVRRT